MSKQSNNYVIHNWQNRPVGKPSPTGEKVYKWQYLNKANELCEDEMNVYEKIQSYEAQVDYKAMIKRGEIFENGNDNYLDISELPTNVDPAALNQYLGQLRESIDKMLAESQKAKPKGQTASEVKQDDILSSSGTESGTGADGQGQGGQE